jgi:hypothetical protein
MKGREKEGNIDEGKRKKDLKNSRRSKLWTWFLNPEHHAGVASLLFPAYLQQDTLSHCFQRQV